jgi:hypothetical protein
LPIVAFLLFAFIAFCIICSITGIIVLGLSWHKVAGYLKARRERDLIALRGYHGRLSLVVSELLSRANELDQQSKYLPAETEAEWNRVYEKLGRALVLMGDTLTIIKERLEEKNVKSGREVTLLLCREATWVSRRLLSFEQKLLSAERKQVEHIKAVQEAQVRQDAQDAQAAPSKATPEVHVSLETQITLITEITDQLSEMSEGALLIEDSDRSTSDVDKPAKAKDTSDRSTTGDGGTSDQSGKSSIENS